MQVTKAEHLFSKDAFPFVSLDELFKKLAKDVPDGYVMVVDGRSVHFVFMIGGELYSAGVVSHEGRKVNEIKDFFAWYKEAVTADLRVYRADKKLLLCMLVRMAHKPLQSFNTDNINLEDVIKKINEHEKDVIMALRAGREWGFAIFIEGKAVYVFLPHEGEGSPGAPLSKLLAYFYSMPEGEHLAVEVYTDTYVVPSEDSAPFPEGGVAAYLGKEAASDAAMMTPPPEAKESSADAAAGGSKEGAMVELLDGGKVIGSYPLKVELTIGRESTNDIVLEEQGVSREHAVMRINDKGKFEVEDKESANGTFFKGIRLTTKELFEGDEINVREYVLRFHAPPETDAEKTERELREAKEDLASQTIYSEAIPDAAVAPKLPSGASVTLDSGEVIKLASITTIGKEEDCDIRLEGMLVGKRHASIIRGRDVYKLIKKGGLSAVKVNGKKITEHSLVDGDEIEVGNHKLVFSSGLK
jgi:pSer/pThr/pTyr-binding forkhead associated (FHA) protein